MQTTHFITGGAGFIGSTLADRLLVEGHRVIVFDNLSTGQRAFLADASRSDRFTLVEADLLDLDVLVKTMAGAAMVWHLAANADVRFGLEHPRKDLEQNTIATHNVLEAMRANNVKKIAFSSTGSIYGEPEVHPTPENAPFPIQTSLYGASKLACEALIQAYCEGFGFSGYIFRFVSVLGERYTHGHVFDFCQKLLADSSVLPVLGNGRQRKSYMYVQDCIDAMLLAVIQGTAKVNIFNLGVDDYVEVNDSIAVITREMRVRPRLEYSGGERGWVGDSPFIWLDTARIRALGWEPKVSIRDAVGLTVQWLLRNDWVFSARNA
ncbi:NAD-dependent epimerase/dehydratase [uncultured delta proteobacterium]|uniref:NAD-dependent epimerase/dehydratase n=1 Tax=uncultured delta proteobacterium TaxID=34034 RepID=A0A212KGS2_9DELT|nr:NAD-dependent epimerase/dehydratase [uncultured delta proteobacterium]